MPVTWPRRISRSRRIITRPESLARRGAWQDRELSMMESLAGGRAWQTARGRRPGKASERGVLEARYMRGEGQSEMEKEQDQ